MPLYPYTNTLPQISSETFIAPSADIIGDVEIGSQSGIWFNTTIRGDVSTIRIGDRVNIQDGSVVHVSRYDGGQTIIGNDITIGHMALIHACELQDGCFIGMKAMVMDHAVVEAGAMVAAGSLVPPGKVVKSGQLWMGSPARYTRDLTDDDRAEMVANCQNYVDLAAQYRKDMG